MTTEAQQPDKHTAHELRIERVQHEHTKAKLKATEEAYETLLKRESGWQPIETAPKNEDILLFGHYLYGGDISSTEYIYLGSWDDGAWLCDDERMTTSSFSHWMPLPKPPLYDIEGEQP